MEKRRVVITGMGCITPIGNSVEEFWDSLLRGRSGAAPITRFDTARFKTRFACQVKDFDPESVLDRKELRKNDLHTVYALAAAREAVEDALPDLNAVDKDRCGVIFASGIGGLSNLEEQLKEFYTHEEIPHFSPFYITKMIANMSAGTIAIRYGFTGVNFAPVSACASSNHALIAALNFIRTGQADLVVSGGAEAAITPSSVGGFNAMRALSTRNDDPAGASRPYDKDRDGFVIGEGAGALVLEEYEHARARGARIYAELCGGGMSCDAYHISATHPDGKGAVLCMENALRDAGLSAADIGYINTHGTSTPVGDIPELTAIARVFGRAYPDIRISSTKSMTGHLLGATSAVEAIASVLAIRNGIIPATINVSDPDPALPAGTRLVLNRPEKAPVRYALSNSFGFGGHNASVIFGACGN